MLNINRSASIFDDNDEETSKVIKLLLLGRREVQELIGELTTSTTDDADGSAPFNGNNPLPEKSRVE